LKYLVDTDWVADYLRAREPALSALNDLALDGLAISIISFGEIYEGIYYGPNVQSHERGFRQFLQWVDVLPLNRSIMRRFARIRGELRRMGQIIGDPDTLIAATALYHGLMLITRNRRHFSRIEGLALYEAS
jgi:tRNA(fMet)-specific endonuclease VapC